MKLAACALVATACVAPAPAPTAPQVAGIDVRSAPSATSMGSPAAPEADSPADPRARAVLDALAGVCDRAWSVSNGSVMAGCARCPRPDGGDAPPGAALTNALPELTVTQLFEAKLFGREPANIVASYEGCQPGILQYAGTLLIDRGERKIVRDDAGLTLSYCRAAKRDQREVLVCVRRIDARKMSAGAIDFSVGVYDPVDLRPTDPDEPAEVAAWHETPVFASDADLHCISGGPAPGSDVRWGRVSGLTLDTSVSPARVGLSGSFSKTQPNTAYRAACDNGGDLGAALGAQPFSLSFTLSGSTLVPSASSRAWIGRNR